MSRFDPEPVFAEPWEAQAFALAVHLQDSGAFDARAWAEALGAELHGRDSSEAGYYARWLDALERLAVARGLVDDRALAERAEAWSDAYVATPHGRPVELGTRS